MAKKLVGVLAIGVLALIAYFGLFQGGAPEPEPERTVVVDQDTLKEPGAGETGQEPAGGRAETSSGETSAPTSQSVADASAPTAQGGDGKLATAPAAGQGGTTDTAPAGAEKEPALASLPASDADAAPAQPTSPRSSAETGTPAATETQPATDPSARVTQETPEAAAVGKEERDPDMPRFDVVRVDQDGQTVIAGTARPKQKVEVLLDGEVVAEARTDGAGAFVAILSAALGGEARQLQLRTRRETPAKNTASSSTVRADSQTSEQAAAPQVGTIGAQPQVPAAPKAPGAPAEVGDAPASLPNTRLPDTSNPSATDDTTALATLNPQAASSGRQPSRSGVAQPAGSAATQPTVPAPEPSSNAADPDYALSAPVIILPSGNNDGAPALVQPQETQVALIQPSGRATSVTLDAIRYGETGAVQLNGRGGPGNSVRIYGNGERLGDTQIAGDGTWAWALARERALDVLLFRFDELEPDGTVANRIETPFTYEALSPKVLREREVVIQRGDALWRIAEQYYGEGIRYSLIYGANSDLIRDPDLIYPGQVFSIPELVDAN